MKRAVDTLKVQLSKVRTGRVSASFLEGIKVDYYGTPSSINQVGQISVPEARLLQIRPFDKSMIAAIEKAILKANLGVTPSNDGGLIRIPFPGLTEQKRKQEVKAVKKMGEETKIAIRGARRDQNEEIKLSEKNKEISEDDLKKFQNEVQAVTNRFIHKVDEIIKAKETEIMTL